MHLSRRNFLRTLGVSAAAGAATQLPLRAASFPAIFASTRARVPSGPMRLDANENTYGPSAKVLATMKDTLSLSNRYPRDEYDKLIDRIASLHAVKSDQLLLGCGSTEILRVTAVGLLGPGKKLVQASPTFEESGEYARSVRADVVAVPLNREFAHDLEAMLARTDSSTNLVYICNPNNPTASITPRKDIENFIANAPSNTYILIDEAYHHSADESLRAPPFHDRAVHDDRLIFSPPSSKIYGLPGLRTGYAVPAPPVVNKPRPFITGDSVNETAARAALTALNDTESARDF